MKPATEQRPRTIGDVLAPFECRVEGCLKPGQVHPGPCKGSGKGVKKTIGDAIRKIKSKVVPKPKQPPPPPPKPVLDSSWFLKPRVPVPALNEAPSLEQIEELARSFDKRWEAAKTPSNRMVPLSDLDQVVERAQENGGNINGIPENQLVGAWHRYKGEWYRVINEDLRAGDVRGETQEDVDALDALMDMSPVKSDLKVYRGMDGERMLGKRFDGYLAGLEWTDKGFTSTSRDVGRADVFGGDTLMRILVPKGTKAIQMQKSGLDVEEETLLQRGLTYRVVSDQGRDWRGIRRIDVEVVPRGED